MRVATLNALRDVGYITTNNDRYHEASQGRSTYVIEFYATATPAGLAYLRGVK